MPATEAELLSIIEKFYEAALEPSQWQSALQALSLMRWVVLVHRFCPPRDPKNA
jgi:hypothetical protein